MAVKNYEIHDKWTDLDKLNNLDIKSVDGVIESVKINGEEAGGGGSSDFSTAEVTVVWNTTRKTVVLYGASFSNIEDSTTYGMVRLDGDLHANFEAILYQQKAAYFIDMEKSTATVSVSGNAELDEELITITGDCTITIS